MPLGRRRGGLVRGVARTAVVAGTASAVSGRVRRRQDQKWSAQEQQSYDQQQAAAQQAQAQQAAAPAPPQEDLVTQIERLGELKEKGLLTEDEFAAQKAKLLA